MRNYLNGSTYRYSFVCSKADLTPEVFDKLSTFVSARILEKRVFLKPKDASGITWYEGMALLQGNAFELTPLLVVVIYGNHWQSFIGSLLQYHACFPPELLQPIALSQYQHLDENRLFDDLEPAHASFQKEVD